MAAKALNNQMTRIVRVNRQRLIETLKANRATHLTVYNEAMAGYKEMALAKVQEAFAGLGDRLMKRKEEMVEKLQTFTAETADKFSDYFIILEQVNLNLKLPVSYIDAYDTAIAIAEFDTRDELDLSGAEFQCFCMDVWDWSQTFEMTNSRYTSSR